MKYYKVLIPLIAVLLMLFSCQTVLKEDKLEAEKNLQTEKQKVILSAREIEANIRADEGWMEEIRLKALERNISVDEMVKLDAQYSFEQQNK